MFGKGASLEQPIFFIGVPRSGTTILFEAFSRHQDLGWPSNYCEMKPNWPALNVLRPLLDNRILGLAGNKKQYGKVLPGNRYFPQPDEAYAFWDYITGKEFSRGFLLGERENADRTQYIREIVRSVVRWQHKPRFAAKLTGPARVEYLSSIFPDAIFIHVIRNGLAVVHSLMGVDFWAEKGGEDRPFWSGGLSEQDLAQWQDSDMDPGVLAAIQWRRIIDSARDEAGHLPQEQYIEVHYEQFIENPHEMIKELAAWCSLDDDVAAHEFLKKGPPLRNMNDRFRKQWDLEYAKNLMSYMQPFAVEFGYEIDELE